MARPAYTITDRDYQYVTDYLSANYLKMTIEKSAGHLDYDAYQNAIKIYNRCRTPKCLQEWCDEWLTSEQWTKLQTAVKKRRSREIKSKKRSVFGHNKAEESITITISTAQAIRTVAQNENLSFAEVVEKYIGHVADKYLK